MVRQLQPLCVQMQAMSNFSFLWPRQPDWESWASASLGGGGVQTKLNERISTAIQPEGKVWSEYLLEGSVRFAHVIVE